MEVRQVLTLFGGSEAPRLHPKALAKPPAAQWWIEAAGGQGPES